jgi:CoA:oxalate CoA-transferase
MSKDALGPELGETAPPVNGRPGPLDGVRVLDLTRFLSGPYTTMILADLGAEVIKVEHPDGGDPSRQVGPFVDGESSYFLSIARGKRSVALDLKDARARDLVLELAERSDILVENFIPGTAARLGLGFEDVHRRNPRLIYASCSGFGQTGPYAAKPAFDMLIQGMAGTVSVTGEPDRPPVRVGFSIGDIGAALFLAVGILAAMHRRTQTGRGEWVEVGMLDCQIALLENAFSRYLTTGEVPRPEGRRHPVATPVQIIETQDGYMSLALGNDRQWRDFCAAIERPDLAADERFRTNPSRTAHRDLLESLLREITQRRTTAEWVALLETHGLPGGPVNRIDALVRDPQVQAREMIVNVTHPRLGTLRVVNSPIRFSESATRVTRACPDAGTDTADVLRTVLNKTETEIRHLHDTGVWHEPRGRTDA